jgi:ADP-ribose pyrophosphatase YjhB (NUDIX family)
MLEKVKKYLGSLEKEAIPQLSLNCVIFGFHGKKLKVIVNKIDLGAATIFVLPGGYIGQREDLTDAVERIVRGSTGLEEITFRQFEVFGKASRSFGNELPWLRRNFAKTDRKALAWVSKRFISVCYLALVDFNKIDLKPTPFLEAQWLPVDEASILAMDHADIVTSAVSSLAKELPYTPIASKLLPYKFTLPDLQALVEAITGKRVDRPNFRRKILSSGLIVKVGKDSSGQRRPADLYRFRHDKKANPLGLFNIQDHRTR